MPSAVLLLMTLLSLMPGFAGPALALTMFIYFLPSFAVTAGVPLIFHYAFPNKDPSIEDEAIESPNTDHIRPAAPHMDPPKHAHSQKTHDNEREMPPPYAFHNEQANPIKPPPYGPCQISPQ